MSPTMGTLGDCDHARGVVALSGMARCLIHRIFQPYEELRVADPVQPTTLDADDEDRQPDAVVRTTLDPQQASGDGPHGGAADRSPVQMPHKPVRTTLDGASRVDEAAPEIQVTAFDRVSEPRSAAEPTVIDDVPMARGSAQPTAVEGAPAARDGESHGRDLFGLRDELSQVFEFGRELGDGGEGQIFRVVDRRDGHELAIKFYKDQHLTFSYDIHSQEYREHFRPEHTVEILDRKYNSAHGYWYDVMEYCPLGSLGSRVGKMLSPERIREIAWEIAQALESMHPIVHGDVKPDNILIRTEDPLDLVLTDFGVTTVNLGDRTNVANDRHAGSIPYMAPEADRNSRAQGDWWSLGITLLELVQGHNPFRQGGRLMEPRKIRERVTTEPVPLDEVTDPRTRQLLAGLLTRSIDKRWGFRQVSDWYQGKNVPVADDSSFRPDAIRASTARSLSDRADGPYIFAGQAYYVPEELGRALQGADSQAQIGRGEDLAMLLDWLAPFEVLSDVKRVSSRAASLGADLTGSLISALLVPDGAPIYGALDLSDAAALQRLGLEGKDGDVSDLYSKRVMRHFSAILDSPQLGVLDDRWHKLVEGAVGAAKTVGLGRDDIAVQARRTGLLAALRGDEAGHFLHDQAGNAVKALGADAKGVTWFSRLADSMGESATDLAIVVSAPGARKEADTERAEQARQREQGLESKREEIRRRISNLEGSIRSEENRRTIPSLRTFPGNLGLLFLGGSGILVAYVILAFIATLILDNRGATMDHLVAWMIPPAPFDDVLSMDPEFSLRFIGYGIWAYVGMILIRAGVLLGTAAMFVSDWIENIYGRPRRNRNIIANLSLLVLLFIFINPLAVVNGTPIPYNLNPGVIAAIFPVYLLACAVDSRLTGGRREDIRRVQQNRQDLQKARAELKALQ